MANRLPNAAKLNLLDTVIAVTNFPERKVLAGDVGAVVEVYTAPALTYEVAFVNPDGSTRALLTLALPRYAGFRQPTC